MSAIARRTIVILAALAAATSLAACNGKKVDVRNDISMGSDNAPVTVLEYASVTCPHCAHWNAEVAPAFKQKYVATGKVRYVIRETPIHGAVDVAGFMLARCAAAKSKDNYFKVIDAIMSSQEYFFTQDGIDAQKYRETLLRIGQQVGISEQAFDVCEGDQDSLTIFNARTDKEAKEFNVDSTPTFVVNGKKVGLDHPPSMEEFSAIIDPLLKK